MNKPLILLSLFLIATMCFVTIPSSAQADSQLDVLIKITQNTQGHLKKDIDKISNVSQEIYDFYDSGVKHTSLLIQSAENGDDVSAKQHFIDAMIAFKQASLAISENQPQITIVDHSPIINKYTSNIQKLKIKDISNMLDCSEGTVKKYLFRAVEKLRGDLEELRYA